MRTTNEPTIFVNQIGHTPDEVKFAYIPVSAADALGAKTFSVVEKTGGNQVFSGTLQLCADDNAAGEPYFYADFSAFRGDPADESKQYQVRIGDSLSFPFVIQKNPYKDLYFSTLNYFKLSRCGQDLCHMDKALVYGTADEWKDVQGGWHDAGDYGRYVVAGAKSVMDLLLAYDFSKTSFDKFDILAEARFELEWMLRMQRDDGGVYHKVSCYHFCAFINPQDEKDRLVLAPVSTSATADFAGTCAYAAFYFDDSDPAFSAALTSAALKAQSYLDTHDDELYINPPEITTGGYGDRDVSDERYFALASLFVRTKQNDFLERALKIRREKESVPDEQDGHWRGWHEHYSWGCVSGYGTEILLENEALVRGACGGQVVEELKKHYLAQAEKSLEYAKKSVFGLDIPHFGWGSNGAVCDVAHVLMVAHKLCGKQEYADVAHRQISYILGCNPLNYCYVTGAGSKSPVKPHHRPSGASGNVMPGMLAGGPDEGLHDAYAKEHLQNLPPLKCYVDEQPSYSTNEIAIYWNSTFVYLLAALYF